MANSIFLTFGGLQDQGGGNVSTPGAITAGSAATGSFYAADGTALLPAYSFTAEPTLGFWRSGANTITTQGALTVTGNIVGAGLLQLSGTGLIAWGGRTTLLSTNVGLLTIQNTGATIGAQLKVDALPTVASGFGAGAAVTAGSTPLAGSVNTGAISASGVVNFNGTAFPSAPFPVVLNQTTGLAVKATATATQLTITSAVGSFGANDVISWVCISSK